MKDNINVRKYNAYFRSLITEQEFNKLRERFSDIEPDFQSNYYFDTDRFTLKAINSSLRVRQREASTEIQLRYHIKKNPYDIIERINEDQFDELMEEGTVSVDSIVRKLTDFIGDQKLHNFLILSTERIYVGKKDGTICIDRNEYLGIVDYDIEYRSYSTPQQARKEFIDIINDLGFSYQKTERKRERAFRRYREYQ